MRNFHKYGIDTHGRTGGKIKTICPECNATRGHKGNKSFSIDLDKGVCYCHHCGYKLYVPDDTEERERQQRKEKYNRTNKLPSHFRRPVFNPAQMNLSENLERYWTEERCLEQRLLAELSITEELVKLPESNEMENCICFNYFENGILINIKYRSGRKHFKMVTGAELIPYNIDAILDTPECIITEGEFDAASFMSAGRKDVISVPAGAQSNLTWMDRFVETHFEPKQLIYIAVDGDNAGQLLQQELIRRLGAERCRLVHFGPECKDANEHLIRYGAESLLITLAQAEEVPLEGVFTAADCLDNLRSLFENGLQRGAETGWSNLDENCTFETRRLLVVTGRPGEGKSEFIDELVLRLCLPRMENMFLQSRKHAHGIPLGQTFRETDRTQLPPRTGHDRSALQPCNKMADRQRNTHLARLGKLYHRLYFGKSPSTGAPSGCAHRCRRSVEPHRPTAETGTDGTGIYHFATEQAEPFRHTT